MLDSKKLILGKFIQSLDYYSERISLSHVIILWLLFLMLSVIYACGGILHPEMEVRLPYYLAEVPLLNKLFDSKILDGGTYQARELSYLFDWVDCKFIEFSVEQGFPHFLSVTFYIFSVVISCLLWWFYVRGLRLRPLIGLGLLALFWTSPSIFLGGTVFRTSKIGVALLVAILYCMIYRIIQVTTEVNDLRISKRFWILYFVAISAMSVFDQQGLFLGMTALVFFAICSLVIRHQYICIAMILSIISLLLHEVHNYLGAPLLTYMLNGYCLDFSYQNLPLGDLIQQFWFYLASGFSLYIDTLRFLTGNPPYEVGIGLFLVWVALPVCLYTRLGIATAYKKKVFGAVLIGLLVTNVLSIIIMNIIMVVQHPPLMWVDVRRAYYWLPTNVIFAMTLGMLISILHKSRIARWLILLVIFVAIWGNIMALPGHKEILVQGHLRAYYQSSPALLNALKNIESMQGTPNLSIEKNSVYQFFKRKRVKTWPDG